MFTEFVLDDAVDENSEAADLEELLHDAKWDEEDAMQEFVDDVRNRIQHERLMVFRLEEE